MAFTKFYKLLFMASLILGIVWGSNSEECAFERLQGAQFISNDTFINLRAKPNGKIIKKLYASDFLVGIYIDGVSKADSGWYRICTFPDGRYPSYVGLIHHSQIAPLAPSAYQDYILALSKQIVATLDTTLQQALLRDEPKLFDTESMRDTKQAKQDVQPAFMRHQTRLLLDALAHKEYQDALFWSSLHYSNPEYDFAHKAPYVNTMHTLLDYLQGKQYDKAAIWANILKFSDDKATKIKQTQAVQYLLTAGFDVNMPLGKNPPYEDYSQSYPLIRAIQANNLDALALIIKHGGKLFYTDASNPLHHAIATTNIQMVRYLLDEGADANEHSLAFALSGVPYCTRPEW